MSVPDPVLGAMSERPAGIPLECVPCCRIPVCWVTDMGVLEGLLVAITAALDQPVEAWD